MKALLEEQTKLEFELFYRIQNLNVLDSVISFIVSSGIFEYIITNLLAVNNQRLKHLKFNRGLFFLILFFKSYFDLSQ